MKFLKDFKYQLKNFQHLYLLVFLLLTAILIFCISLTGALSSGYTDITSARYLLSAEAQSQAAIVAIVVTLTLIAIQLSAQSYSSRVITAFVKHKALWLLLVLYGISIFYDLLILGLISENFPYLGIFIGISLFLQLVTFSALFPYTQFVIKKLNPKEIILDLSKQINKEELLAQIDDLVIKENITFESFNEETLLRPIIDVTKTSIIKKDAVTARDGIVEIKNLASLIISENQFNEKQTQKIMKFFFWHIHEIWEIVLAENDQLTAKEVLLNLKDIVKINRHTLNSIPLWYYEVFLDLFFNTAKKNGWEGFLNANIMCQIELAHLADRYDLEPSFSTIYNTLGDIGIEMESGEYPYSHFVYDINQFLGWMANVSASKEWGSSMAGIFEYITKTSRFLIEDTQIIGSNVPLKDLEMTAQAMIDNDFHSDVWWVKAFRSYLLHEVYGEIGAIYAKKGYDVPLAQMVRSLIKIGTYVVKSRHEKKVEGVIEALEYMGVVNCKEGGNSIDRIFDAFNEIKNETSPAYLQEINSNIEDCTRNMVREIFYSAEREGHKQSDYLFSLIQIGRDYGFDEIVREKFNEYEKREALLDSEDKSKFKWLKDSYLKALSKDG